MAERDDDQGERRLVWLVCAECKTGSDDKARGWRALPADDDDEIVIYCPDCAAREFDTQ